ncbi:AcrR family transcriptional regulator [Parabacteroides sp. PF5-5]|uniref:TetR/AcrR family transcriptional regulator n=1 Tax=unclassified Parabacteroides TaxID=2649774 RepID=UPI0024753BEA|nr:MULTISPECIES: TetR/AcrR family transcriptional regulator [unclassified Parabacteroides]MDH6304798.1 AcrR family transcriptional regulator [Parabacteroides sp. PH5-39]MDH6315587.1 AcrR family transcriptional regulator [Parabacteroides sp. PF5-13]MDH6319248.1 AcrR family transcriptional regulator [Parabacteroides sp. PH5-13]MDH6322979.1 AcrR family transcriptional regulator [Parabacteroides sp. PH5-8]MDH6326780.1 AcrR family transcriptional regulator [Parabacteroides sp. PH5-41]
MIKEQIITTALDLFSQYGIKNVSMDDIARNMSISKRTLYGFFEDKETLLMEGVEYTNNRLGTFLSQLEKEPHTALDIIILFYEELMKRPRWYNPKYYEDMRRYPRVMEKRECDKSSFTTICTRLFNRGVKEGVFQDDVNFEIVGLLAKEQMKMIRPSKTFSKHTNSEVYNTVLITFLRGICTDKGRKILERWITVKQIYHIQ